MKLRYNYKLYPNSSQKTILNNHFFTSNQAFNICLSLSKKEYEENQILKESGKEQIYLSDTELDNEVKSILTNRNLTYNTKVLQQSRKNFRDSMKRFFKSFDSNNRIGMIGFKKSSSTFGSFETTSEQYQIKDFINSKGKVSKKWKILRLFNQSFKIRYHRELPSEPKTITISLKDNEYSISFVVEKIFNHRKTIHSTEYKKVDGIVDKCKTKLKPIALDINLDSLDLGTKKIYKKILNNSKNNNLIVNNSKKIKRLQRKQSKRILKYKKSKEKLPKAFTKTQSKINKLFKKNNDKRVFNLHALTNEILQYIKDNKYNYLVVEDLNVKAMTDKKNINKLLGKKKSKSMKKNILHISFGKILNQLIYKCAINEIYIKKVDPKNTSKSCSKCGNIKEDLNLSDRNYNCENCGFEIARDWNACINILSKG